MINPGGKVGDVVKAGEVSGRLTSLASLIRLDQRVVVVTGGGQGIGRAVCLRMAEAGAVVFVADRNESATVETVRMIAEAGGQALSAAVDIADSAGVAKLALRAADHSDRLDAWINCAAITGTSRILDMTDEVWSQMISVDLDGAFFCAREAARQMLGRSMPGVIVLVSSLSGFRGRVGRTHYGAAKHGVNGIVRSLATELGPQGIRVVGIAPSVTNTAMFSVDGEQDGIDESVWHEMMDAAIAGIPMKRIADPDEIARGILFAVSDLGSFVSGSIIHIDGGASGA